MFKLERHQLVIWGVMIDGDRITDPRDAKVGFLYFFSRPSLVR